MGPNEALQEVEKAFESEKTKKTETLFQKKNRLLKTLEDARKKEVILIREKAILEGENGKEGFIAGLQKRVESETKHLSCVIAKKESLELGSKQLDEAKLILADIDSDAAETKIGWKLKERIPEKFKKSETDLILEVLVNKYVEEIEQIGEKYYENLKVDEIQYKGESLGVKNESESASKNPAKRASGYLDDMIKRKEQIINMLECRKKNYAARDDQLKTQNIAYSEKMGQVNNEINSLVQVYKQKEEEFLALKAEDANSDTKPVSDTAGNHTTSTETFQKSQNHSKISNSTSKMHEILKTAHTEILSSTESRNVLIRKCYKSVACIRPVFIEEDYIIGSQQKTTQFSAKPWKDAFGGVDWEETTENIEKVIKVFVELQEKHEGHQKQFMDKKDEVKQIWKVEKKEMKMESGGAGQKKRVKIENPSNDNEVIEID